MSVTADIGAEGRRDARAAALRAMVEPLMERVGIPGVAVGILYGGVHTIEYFGVTSVEHPLPVDAATLFQIGSTTKTVTATALMRLVERGLLDLDAPVRTYLPDLRLADEAVAAAVTTRHLLSHVGGWLGDYFDDPGPGDDALATMVRACERLPQLTPLGTLWSYNNAAFYIAGHVLEVLHGKPYEASVREVVLEPIGMADSFFFAHEVITRRFVVGHVERDGRPEVSRDWYIGRGAAPAGGLVSTAGDQLRYAAFHMGDGDAPQGTRALSAASLAAMQTPLVAAANPHESMGVGWFIHDRAGVRTVRHGGATAGQTSSFAFLPEHRFAITILTNSDRGGDIFEDVETWALREYLGIEQPDEDESEVPAAELAQYTGEYSGAGSDAEVRADDGHLVLQVVPKGGFPKPDSPPEPTPPPVRLRVGAEDRFVALEDPFKGAKGQFLRDGVGSIVWLRLFGRIHRRVQAGADASD